MSLVAPVKNGELVQTTETTTSTETKSGSTLGKDAFLQLLVAQMKYQDPLEPTSNTEYISQLATFSSLEEMQNMTSALNLQRASSLVGQEVYVKTVDSITGSSGYVHGKVDFVTYENGKAYVSINGNNYPLDDVDSIYDPEYSKAYELAYNWTVGLNKLPRLTKLSLSNQEAVEELQKTYEGMTTYQKTFLTKENIEKLEKYVEQMEKLKKAAKEADSKDDKTEETGKTEESGKTEETGKTEESDKTEETGKTEESDKTEETSKTEESDKTAESEEAKESAASGEAAKTQETEDTVTTQEDDSEGTK